MQRLLPILLFAVCSLNGGLALLRVVGTCGGGVCSAVEMKVCRAVGTCSGTNPDKGNREKKQGKKPACCGFSPNCCVYLAPVVEWPVWHFPDILLEQPEGRQRCFACGFMGSVWRPPDFLGSLMGHLWVIYGHLGH